MTNTIGRSRFRIVLLAMLFLIPPVLAYAMYFWVPQWIPRARVNNGTLLNPARPLPHLQWQGAAAQAVVGGRWSLLLFGGRRCEAACVHRLTLMRNLREVLRGDAHRVRVVYVAPDVAALPAARSALAGLGSSVTVVAPDASSAPRFAAFFASPKPGTVAIIDPLGNWVLYYNPGDPPKSVYLDLKRLLHYSQIG